MLVTAESMLVTAESGLVTAESGLVTAESRLVTAESGLVTAESARDGEGRRGGEGRSLRRSPASRGGEGVGAVRESRRLNSVAGPGTGHSEGGRRGVKRVVRGRGRHRGDVHGPCLRARRRWPRPAEGAVYPGRLLAGNCGGGRLVPRRSGRLRCGTRYARRRERDRARHHRRHECDSGTAGRAHRARHDGRVPGRARTSPHPDSVLLRPRLGQARAAGGALPALRGPGADGPGRDGADSSRRRGCRGRHRPDCVGGGDRVHRGLPPPLVSEPGPRARGGRGAAGPAAGYEPLPLA